MTVSLKCLDTLLYNDSNSFFKSLLFSHVLSLVDKLLTVPIPRYAVISTIAGVTIGLEQTSYTVNENENSRQVCAVLSSGIQIPVSITLTTVDQSAISMSMHVHKQFPL